MSLQIDVGITPNCLQNQLVQTISTFPQMFHNDLANIVTFDIGSGANSVQSGQHKLGGGSQSNLGIVTNTLNNSKRIAILARYSGPHDFYASWFPICTVTSMCNSSQSYVGGGSAMTIKYYGDQFTIYKLVNTGIFSSILPTLITDSDLGKYWQFSATANDFIVVVSGATQFQLQFIESGFYYFPDMSVCENQVWLGSMPATSSKTSLLPSTLTTPKSQLKTSSLTSSIQKTTEATINSQSSTIFKVSTEIILSQLTKNSISKTLRVSFFNSFPIVLTSNIPFVTSLINLNGRSTSTTVTFSSMTKISNKDIFINPSLDLNFVNNLTIYSLIRLFISFGVLIYVLTTWKNLKVMKKASKKQVDGDLGSTLNGLK